MRTGPSASTYFTDAMTQLVTQVAIVNHKKFKTVTISGQKGKKWHTGHIRNFSDLKLMEARTMTRERYNNR